MVFSSLYFLFIFLPLALACYYVAPKKLRNLVLLIASLIFYAWGEPVYIVLMIFSSVVDYFHGLLVQKYRNNNQMSKAKLVVASSVVINLALLCFFKYSDFLIINLNNIFGTSIATLNLALPIGISFYTFQTMSYTIDVYRGDAPAQKSPIALATYVTLFPQLIAGPIVRYRTVAEQINFRKENLDSFSEGIRRFIVGLGKKVLLANNIGMLWDQIQSSGVSELTVLTAWLGAFAFGMQIYFDFSGYSDMAIGLGKMFGFDFLENFNYPYISQSISEFWRRWHISLGTWFKDYVYIPLGGNRGNRFKVIRNLFIVWFLTGLWHGASWNFVLWGIFFGVLIGIEKMGLEKILKKAWRPIRHIYVLVLLAISWILFAFDNASIAFDYMKAMFGMNSTQLYDERFIYYFMTNLILIIMLVLASTPIFKKISKKLKNKFVGKYEFIYSDIFVNISYVVILLITTAYLADATYNPFLYFRF